LVFTGEEYLDVDYQFAQSQEKQTVNFGNKLIKIRKEKMYVAELESSRNKIIQPEDDTYDVVRLLVRKRRKTRFQTLDIIHSVLRITMLSRSLDLPL
jgi:hypothetical protein